MPGFLPQALRASVDAYLRAGGGTPAPAAELRARPGPDSGAPPDGLHPGLGLGSQPTAAVELYPERARFTRAEALLVLGFWTLIAVLTSANSLLEPRTSHPWQPIVPLAPVILAFANSYLWALLTLPIFRLASWYTIERSSWLSRVMFVVLGLVLAVLVDAATGYLRHQLYYSPTPLSPELEAIARVRALWFMNEFIVYVAVLAAGFARNYFLNYRVRLTESINLKAQAAQLQAQLADARLSALRTQLNPHFLFNTLNAVSALVERDPRGVRRMIARLSELLRTSLDEADEPEVPLQRELTFVERYLEVMQIRFQGRLHVRLHADPDVSGALVPNLILQPLVENAVKHGVSKMVGAGRVEIRAHRAGARMVLCVIDNGPGLASGKLPSAEGVGLRNTRMRLAQLYGSEQSLTLRTGEGGGLIAEVSLPFHTQADLRTAAVAAEV
ncbi:MAG TPA: histidine kinase [Steroidobacteraceae bacterium]|nr:histidine kinase [Steroidobacteraceae bacterium]